MSFTAADLKDAIHKGDTPRARAIIQRRDFDLNNIDEMHGSAFQYVLMVRREKATPKFRYDILMEILAARDQRQHPRINLNAQNQLRMNPLGCLITLSTVETCLSLPQVRGLVDALINLRYPNGDRCLNLDAATHHKIMIQAIMTGDPAIVQLFVDLRNADGSLTLDVNKIYVQNNQEYTALDVAHSGVPIHHDQGLVHVPNQAIIDILLAAGAQRSADIPRHQPIVEVIPVPAMVEVHAAPREVPDVAEEVAFEDNPQNVHNPQVERTVDMAIAALANRYPHADVATTYAEIQAFINSKAVKKFYSADDHASIQAGFDYLNEPTVANAIHATSNFTMNEILAFVWAGANDKDKASLPGEQTEVTDAYIHLRRMALCDQLRDIATTYPRHANGAYHAACLGGTRNRLIASLDKAHRDVTIAPTRDAAVEFALSSALAWERDQLLKLEMNTQCNILNSWETVSEGGPAHEFHYSCRAGMLSLLNENFGALIDQDDIHHIVGDNYYHELPRPIMITKMSELIDKILAIYSQDALVVSLAVPIQRYANHAYIPELTYPESCARLQQIYEVYCHLKEALENIRKKELPHLLAETANILEQAANPELSVRDAYRMIEKHFHGILHLLWFRERTVALQQLYKGKNPKRADELKSLAAAVDSIIQDLDPSKTIQSRLEDVTKVLVSSQTKIKADHLEHGFFRKINRRLDKKDRAFTKGRAFKLVGQVLDEYQQFSGMQSKI